MYALRNRFDIPVEKCFMSLISEELTRIKKNQKHVSGGTYGASLRRIPEKYDDSLASIIIDD